MDAKLAIGKGFSKKIVDLISRPDLVSMPGNPVFEIWQEIRKLLPDFQVVEGDEVMERSQQQQLFGGIMAICGSIWIRTVRCAPRLRRRSWITLKPIQISPAES